MRLGSRSLIIPVVLASFGLTASAVPGRTWPTTAMLSLGSGVAAVSLMALLELLRTGEVLLRDTVSGLMIEGGRP